MGIGSGGNIPLRLIQHHITSFNVNQHHADLHIITQPQTAPCSFIQLTCTHPTSHQPKPFLFRRVVTGVTGARNEYPLYPPEAYPANVLAECKRV